MKIVIIDKEEGFKISGVTIYTQRLFNHLSQQKHAVSILRYSKNPSAIKNKHIYSIPYYYGEPRSYIFLPSEKSYSTIRKYLKQIKPDLVYLYLGLSPVDFFIPGLCEELDIPLAGVWHMDFNSHKTPQQFLMKSIFLAHIPLCRQLEQLVVFSEKFKTFYSDYGLNPQKVTVIPNGVDANFYTPGPSQFAKMHDIKHGVLFLGRLTFQKNPEVLIKSFLSIDPPSDTKLVMVGHGDLEKSLRNKYRDPRIIFTGIVTNEKHKLDIMRACQLFVLPSSFEGMSLALLEAMATGLACIATDAGGNSEVLHGAGLIIPVTHLSKILPNTLKKYLESKILQDDYGQKARSRVIRNFDQYALFSALSQTFNQVVQHYKHTKRHL